MDNYSELNPCTNFKEYMKLCTIGIPVYAKSNSNIIYEFIKINDSEVSFRYLNGYSVDVYHFEWLCNVCDKYEWRVEMLDINSFNDNLKNTCSCDLQSLLKEGCICGHIKRYQQII